MTTVNAAGRDANEHATEARDEVEAVALACGYRTRRGVLVGESIFRTPLRVPVVVDGVPRYPSGVALAVVTQHVPGSAESKLCRVVLDMRDRCTLPGFIILVGNGFSDGAVRWAQEQADGRRLINVIPLDGLAGWLQA